MVKIPVQKRKREAGQAIILVVVAMGVFLFGAVGLAIDGSHMYAQRQMAQAAADAGAQAGILSIFNGTNTSGAHAFTASSTVATCSGSGPTPCYYAQRNGFDPSSDTVTYDAPATDQLRVTVQRSVSTTLIRFFGPTAATIKATGTAAIVNVVSPVPILVTSPTASGALSMSGNPSITICGGPNRSIQVNSNSATAFSANGSWSVDLQHAGPLDPGDCSAGTGADFGVFGGPNSAGSGLNAGTTGQYVQPASPISDPLASVTPPPVPSAAPAKTALADGVSGCPASPPKACQLYSPGLYASGINIMNETAVFKPGIYYFSNGGLSTGAHGGMEMATGFTDPGTGWTGNVLFYNTGSGTFDIAAANSSANLVGSPAASAYKGILFFQDRAAAAKTHNLGGGGQMSLTGTVYMPGATQTLNLQGGSGSGTLIQGEVIIGKLSLSGNSGIHMNLNGSGVTVRQIALIH